MPSKELNIVAWNTILCHHVQKLKTFKYSLVVHLATLCIVYMETVWDPSRVRIRWMHPLTFSHDHMQNCRQKRVSAMKKCSAFAWLYDEPSAWGFAPPPPDLTGGCTHTPVILPPIISASTPGNGLPLLSYLMFSSPLLMLVSITNKQILYCIILYCICAKILKHNCTYYYTIYIIMHICIHNFIRVPLFSLVILQDCHNITGVFICQIFGLLGFVLVVSSVVYCGSGAFSGYAVNQFFDFIIMLCVITTAILYVTRLFKLHLRIFRCTCCFWPTVVSL